MFYTVISQILLEHDGVEHQMLLYEIESTSESMNFPSRMKISWISLDDNRDEYYEFSILQEP